MILRYDIMPYDMTFDISKLCHGAKDVNVKKIYYATYLYLSISIYLSIYLSITVGVGGGVKFISLSSVFYDLL